MICRRSRSSYGSLTPFSHARSLSKSRKPIAFAFDIDGVLLRSAKPIPGATEALEKLKKRRVPFILLTNGGGLSEASRVVNLTKSLGTEISPKQFIQSHTPWSQHPEAHGFKNVLVSGGRYDVCREVALGYGFPHVTIPFDILATSPAIWPYHNLSDEERACTRPLSKDPIDAVYVYHDPRDWGLDSQIILDVLLSQAGVIGTRQTQDIKQAIPIFFSNPDLIWANAYAHPRLGQGAFKILMEGLYSALTGSSLVSEQIGKPSRVTYEYARQILADYQSALSNGEKQEEGTVYMVGDNKASDIQGANDFGWSSILVRTGVFRGTQEEALSGDIPAKHCVQDVGEAVDLVLKKHGIR